MGVTVSGVKAVEILDSRGNPTLAVTVTLGDGTIAQRRRTIRRIDRYAGGSRAPGWRPGPLRRQRRSRSCRQRQR